MSSNLSSALLRYEEDGLDWDETLRMFQELINTGLVWQLQGSYGRTAVQLMKQGFCSPARKEA